MNLHRFKSLTSSATMLICLTLSFLPSEKGYAGINDNAASAIFAGAAFGGPAPHKIKERVDVNLFHVEPQIIYRLDDHRYVELSYYESCDSTPEDRYTAEAYYYDTQLGIKTQISSNIRNFIGRIINADPTGKNIAFAGSPNEFFVSDMGNGPQWVAYSTDYGRTFSNYSYGNGYSYTPIEDSEQFTVIITESEISVYGEEGAEGAGAYVLDFTNKDDKGKFIQTYRSNLVIPNYSVIMDRYQCDNSIKGELEVMPIGEFKEKYRNNDDSQQ